MVVQWPEASKKKVAVKIAATEISNGQQANTAVLGVDEPDMYRPVGQPRTREETRGDACQRGGSPT